MSFEPLPQMMEDLTHWITEREKIRVAKEAGEPPPWTEDPYLGAWRFCNVSRNDDVVTRWIFENITLAHDYDPSLYFNLAIARFINWPDTLAALGYYDTAAWGKKGRKTFCSRMKARREEGEKVYTGAYMIRAGTGEDAKLTKEAYLAKRVFDPLASLRRPDLLKTCEDWNVALGGIFGMGDFMRNQIITDLKYSHHLRGTSDWDSFVLAGPGTKRGLNRLIGQELRTEWKVKASTNALLQLRRLIIALLPEFRGILTDLNNLSNCMCEFDKYQRLKRGEGTPRSKYVPKEINNDRDPST